MTALAPPGPASRVQGLHKSFPPVVFLDEPTTGLDPEARLEVW